MTNTELEMMKAAGLTEQDFQPKDRLGEVEKRTDALETTTDDMILLMADLIGGNGYENT